MSSSWKNHWTQRSTSVWSPLIRSGAEGQWKTYRRCCCILCSLRCSLGLVVFGATIAAVTVDVRLSGALLAVDFTWIRCSSSLGSGLPQEGAHPLNGAPSWHLARKIWAQNNTKIRPNLNTSVWPILAELKMLSVNQRISWTYLDQFHFGLNSKFFVIYAFEAIVFMSAHLIIVDIINSKDANLCNRTFCIPVLLRKCFWA